MGECFTCGGVGSERYTMVLDAETVLDDVVMCETCRDSYAEVSWIEIGNAPVPTRDGAPCRVTEATD